MSNPFAYNPTCDQLNCVRDNQCCLNIGGINTCAVSSRCHDDPVWMSIVLPAVLFLLAVILLAIACYKICSARKQTMKVRNFARKEIRMQTKPSHQRLSTLTSIY